MINPRINHVGLISYLCCFNPSHEMHQKMPYLCVRFTLRVFGN